MSLIEDKIIENNHYITKYNLEIKSLQKILDLTKSELKAFNSDTMIHQVYAKIKSCISSNEYRHKEITKENEFLLNLNRTSELSFIIFKASHRQFRKDEIVKNNKDIHKFSSIPFVKDIDSEMSDEVSFYVSEDIDLREAQLLWTLFLENQFDEHDNEKYSFGDLLSWNGTEIKFIK